jgi:hypothetical protein
MSCPPFLQKPPQGGARGICAPAATTEKAGGCMCGFFAGHEKNMAALRILERGRGKVYRKLT